MNKIIAPDDLAIDPARAEAPPIDVDYICRAFNLVRVADVAVNPGCVQFLGGIGEEDSDRYWLRLNDGHSIEIDREEMAELETNIRRREVEIQQLQAEAIARQAQAQMQATNDAIQNAALAGRIQRRRGS